jgi:histidine ammonia-lyase
MADNAAGVIGIELLAAVQGIDFHAPLRTSPPLETAVQAIRAFVPHLDADRYLAHELAWAKRAVLDGGFDDLVAPVLD